MEIQTIVLEAWMCRICLTRGSYDIFKHHLLPPKQPAQQQTAETAQGHQQRPACAAADGTTSNSVSIAEALNYFSEFKISPSEIANEPIMLCESCCAELLQCYQFRIKLNEAECLLRRDSLSQDIDEETKTGLTLQLMDIEPFLEDIETPPPGPPDLVQSESLPAELPSKPPPKIHHAKPRFQLTNQVSNILRHVASSSNTAIIGAEKRKDLEDLSEPTTPKKLQRRSSSTAKEQSLLDQTLVVPSFVFANEIDEHAQLKTVLLVEKSVVSAAPTIPTAIDHHQQQDPTRTPSPEDGEIFYCKHCPKAFSSAHHLLSHTKSAHLCQHCLKHLPNAQARNRHVREEHKSFRCTLCSSFRSPYAANLRAHLRRTHSVVLPAHVSILQHQAGNQSGNK